MNTHEYDGHCSHRACAYGCRSLLYLHIAGEEATVPWNLKMVTSFAVLLKMPVILLCAFGARIAHSTWAVVDNENKKRGPPPPSPHLDAKISAGVQMSTRNMPSKKPSRAKTAKRLRVGMVIHVALPCSSFQLKRMRPIMLPSAQEERAINAGG